MESTEAANDLNGVDVTQLEAFRTSVRRDPSLADRRATVVAEWLNGSRSRVEYDGQTMYLGGEDDLNAMQALLGCLAACDIDLVAMHAARLGVALEKLRVETSGVFNGARYLGLDSDHGPGYQHIDYRVRLAAPSATDAQIEELRRLCERASPIGDTLTRAVPMTLHLHVDR
jgi:uncharacterized OsmC-like protein